MSEHEADSMRLTIALLAIGVAAVSFAAPIAAATAAPALAVAFWRNAFASLGVLPYAALRRRPEIAAIWRRDRKVLGTAGWAGVALAVHFGLWIPSLRMTSVTASTALVTTTPLFTLGIDWARGNRPRAGVLVGVLVAFVGVLLITGVDAGSSGRQLLGDALALAGGAAAAVYTVLGSEVRRTASTATYTAIAYPVCALLLLPVCWIAGQPVVGFDATTWGQLLALTLTAQLLGHSILNRALRTAGATTVALAILLEVPGAVLLAWVLFGQVPPLAVIPGAALVLVGLALVVRARTSASRVESALEVGNVTD